MKNHFHKNFKKLRKTRGTQAKVSYDLMVSHKALAKWEEGKSAPRLSQIVDIADYFKVTIDQLLKTQI